MKYPIGIQTFDELRTKDFVYVDKTEFVYKMVSETKYYFLSRPRRFGKSLLLSTLRAYFEGKKELFSGLAIEKLEKDWTAYPVLHIDLNTVGKDEVNTLEVRLDAILSRMEKQWGVGEVAPSPAIRLENVIHAAYEATGRQVVVLVDEYDKPILAHLESNEKSDAVRSKLKAFYSVLKSEDRYIRFALLTGVTRFSRVSIFSDLNNLNDLSMDPDYAAVCGVTEEELHAVFDKEVGVLAEANKMIKEDCYAQLAKRYDGYHFAYDTPGIYNPFSLLKTLSRRRFEDYWFSSGTPTFLITVLKNTSFDFSVGLQEPVSEAELANVDSIERSPVPILFQSGYLTIKEYDSRLKEYVLDYPNEEVREGFVNFMLPYYTGDGQNGLKPASRLLRSLEQGRPEEACACLKDLFDRNGNCMMYEGKSKERDFRNIVYMVFSFLGLYTETELNTARGRLDVCCQTKDYVYIFELKMDKSAKEALDQIEKNGYDDRFRGDSRRLIRVGVNFSSEKNSIDECITEG